MTQTLCSVLGFVSVPINTSEKCSWVQRPTKTKVAFLNIVNVFLGGQNTHCL